jgi:hypothetical protein
MFAAACSIRAISQRCVSKTSPNMATPVARRTNKRPTSPHPSKPVRPRLSGLTTRQAGGHWFEPSTAHLAKAPLERGFCFRAQKRRGPKARETRRNRWIEPRVQDGAQASMSPDCLADLAGGVACRRGGRLREPWVAPGGEPDCKANGQGENE